MGLRSLNNSKSSFDDPYARTAKDAVTPAPPPSTITASGGTEFTTKIGSDFYKVHQFTSSGTFTVTEGAVGQPAAFDNLEYLVVAGG